VLLELYMSGEFAYTLGRIAELGLVEQSMLHSRTSQYGSMSRGIRFVIPELRTKMMEGLEEIRSGKFAQEWAAEQAAGTPTLQALREAAQTLPLVDLERELRQALGDVPAAARMESRSQPTAPTDGPAHPKGWLSRILDRIRRLPDRMETSDRSQPAADTLSESQMEEVLCRFLASAEQSAGLQAFAQERDLTTHYLLRDSQLEFAMSFQDGEVTAGLGPPPSPAEVTLETEMEVLDGMFTGRINAMRAFMSGGISFSGEAKLAISIQQIQDDLRQLYTDARNTVV
jgi:putative sterol carrier protein